MNSFGPLHMAKQKEDHQLEPTCEDTGCIYWKGSLRVALDNGRQLCLLISKVKLATIVEGNPKAPFSIATTPRCRRGRYSFPGFLYFTLDPYLLILSVKQGGIKYHFLSFWSDSTWDWTQVSRAIGEHCNP